MPKFNLIYFKNIVDSCLYEFFDIHQNDFSKNDDKYILSKSLSRTRLHRELKHLILNKIDSISYAHDVLNPRWLIVIGSCVPCDNMLLKFNSDNLPSKLNTIIHSDVRLKYILKEKDINIDIVKLNQVLDDIFNEMFTLTSTTKFRKDVIFIKNKNLDCYQMFKVLKHILGKSNCINILKDDDRFNRSVIVAINDLISKYSSRKIEMTRSSEFKCAMIEIKQHLSNTLKYDFK